MSRLEGRRVGIGLVILGAFGALNAIVASMAGAEKSYYMDRFVNTHWITIIQLFAGFSHLFLSPRDISSATLCLVTNTLSLAICCCSVFADFTNLSFLMSEKADKIETDVTVQRMVSYCAVDSILALTAIPLNIIISKQLLKSDHSLPIDLQCVRLLTLGTTQIALSVFRMGTYFAELMWLKSMNSRKVRLLFVNYTLDEPAWLTVNILVGIFCVLSARGGRLLRSSSLVFCALSIIPCVFYLWLDYRWFSSVHLAPTVTARPTSNPLLATSISLGFAHIGVLISTLLILFGQVCPSSRIRLDTRLRALFFSVGVLFLCLTATVFFLDIYALVNKLFYRLFHGSEQKTPFLLLLTAIFSLLSTNPTLSAFTLPACLTLCLMSINSTVFLLLSYIYLSSNNYFGEKLCDLFFPTTADCFEPVTLAGASIHLIEALTSFSILILSSIVAAIILRLSRLRKPEEIPSIQVQNSDNRKYEVFVRIIGVTMAGCALLVIICTLISYFAFKRTAHPLVVVYLSLYHISLAISLIVYPLYQIIASDSLAKHPLSTDALLMISSVRFIEILSQLDYRGTGDQLSLAWKIHHCVEILSLFGHFFTVVCVLATRRSTTELSISDTVPMQFDNPLARTPLAESEAGTGYIQLRTQEDDI